MTMVIAALPRKGKEDKNMQNENRNDEICQARYRYHLDGCDHCGAGWCLVCVG